MTKKLATYGLAIVEILVGVGALAASAALLLDREAGMALLLLPFIAAWIPLALMGALVFVRRKWVYYSHFAVLVVIGLSLTALRLYYLPGQLVPALLVRIVPALPVLGVLLLPSVRQYFGVYRYKDD